MRKTVSFYGTCSSRSELTLVSEPITHPFRVKKIRAKFAGGCENKVRLEFVLAADNDAPVTGRPNGSSLLADYGQVSYLVGNDEVVVLEHEVDSREGNAYVKVYAFNGDWYDHDVLVQITIETLERR